MSIVLVVIGLITGGILLGSDMVEAARIRSTIGDLEKYKSAANAFRLKYNCIPGDCTNATDFFGDAGSICNNVAYDGNWYSTTVPTGTCNGNGDGKLDSASAGYQQPGSGNSLFWDHLSKAGLIAGESMVQVPNGGPYQSLSPPAALNSYFSVTRMDNTTYGNVAPLRTWVSMMNHNLFVLGYTYFASAVPPAIAFAIDTKLDDGLPGVGTVYGENGSGGFLLSTNYGVGCVSMNVDQVTFGVLPPNTAMYDLSQTGNNCNLAFFAGF
jgi:hypothetical protein